MGQYYKPLILRQKGKRTYSEGFYSHYYDHNGLKLTEHSWCGNHFTETVLAQLFNKPGRLYWMGDYTDKEDFEDVNLWNKLKKIYKKFQAEIDWNTSYDAPDRYIKNTYTCPEMVTSRVGRFILNHDKKVYIDMEKYEKEAIKNEWTEVPLHPVPLLTCTGNGRGGGDYYGPGSEECGTWAGDLIETQDVRPNGYTDVTENYLGFEDK